MSEELLLASDELFVHTGLVSALKATSIDLHITTVTTGASLLAAIRAKNFDAVLIGKLADTNATRVTRYIRSQLELDVPIMVMSDFAKAFSVGHADERTFYIRSGSPFDTAAAICRTLKSRRRQVEQRIREPGHCRRRSCRWCEADGQSLVVKLAQMDDAYLRTMTRRAAGEPSTRHEVFMRIRHKTPCLRQPPRKHRH